jgi:hypothetical protein
MHLAVIVLKEESLVHRVARMLVEMERCDAAVLDGEGIDSLAARSVPLVSGIADLFGRAVSYNRVLLVPVDHREQVDDLVRACRRDGVDLAAPAVADVWIVPCERYEPPD